VPHIILERLSLPSQPVLKFNLLENEYTQRDEDGRVITRKATGTISKFQLHENDDMKHMACVNILQSSP
jgi:hypothetical protein